MGRVMRWVVGAVFVTLVVSAITYTFRKKPLQVEMATVVIEPMQVTVSAEGRSRVRDRFVVSSPIEGRLGRIEAKEGAAVRRGSVLAWITPAPLEIRSERQRRAALEAAEAEVQSEEARVAQVRVNLEQAERELRRVSGLVQSGVRPSQELDSARTAVASARQAVEVAISNADAAAHRVDEVKSSLIRSEAQAVAVRSPADGVVLRVHQQSERVVLPGATIVEIGDARKLELVFDVLSSDAMKIRPGAKVAVRNGSEGEPLSAVVQLVEPGAFTKTSALGVEEQRVNVVAVLSDTVPGLGDGYRVDGEIVVWDSPRTPQIPVSALFRIGSEWNVFVAETGTASLRAVKIGQRNERRAEILSGLTEGDVVILYPDDRLTPGAKIVR